jgi:GNAT superfamily N-acetyltransferase
VSRTRLPAGEYTSRALDDATWPAFAELVERNNGVWGGCWCMGFHPEGFAGGQGMTKDESVAANRRAKEARVASGGAHAALVFEGDTCLGWCQFGSPAELTRIKALKAYRAAGPETADWRITCFFVDRAHRHRGVAAAALDGALALIAAAGGGLVESFPEDVEGRTTSGSFLHNATTDMFESRGFTKVHQLGKHRWLVTRQLSVSS